MAEYMIECASGVGDTIDVQESDGGGLRFVARRHGDFKSDLFASCADARTFARGILALADEVDGGEEKAEPDNRPKVGDRLRITKDNPRHAPVKKGDVITVASVDYDAPHADEDHVRFLADGDGADDYQWFVPLSAVEPATESASKADPAPRMPAVGDRVRVLTDGADSANVAVGDVFTVTSLGRSDFHTDAGWYFRPESVEILPASTAAVAITRPTREAYLHRAAEFLGANPSAHDLIELASYLAGE